MSHAPTTADQDLEAALSLLDDTIRSKLHDSGYRHAKDFATVSLGTLSEDSGVDSAALVKFLRRLRGGCNLEVKGKVATKGKTTGSIVTFCEALDKMLSGGIALGRLTEVVGEEGSGKTQFCMQLALNAQIFSAFGGVHGCAIVIDTEGGINGTRLAEMAKHLAAHLRSHGAAQDAFTAEYLMKNILVVRVFSSAELMSAVAMLRPRAQQLTQTTGLPLKLVVVDSVAAPFRCEGGGDGEKGVFNNALLARQRALALLGKALTDLAVEAHAAVVVTNHVTARWQDGDDTTDKIQCVAPALGNMWGHEVTDRLALFKSYVMSFRFIYLISTSKWR